MNQGGGRRSGGRNGHPRSNAGSGRPSDTRSHTPPPHRRRLRNIGGSVVQYLHVNNVPKMYSAGKFVFLSNARMPLHDHPNIVVLTRVLYGELEVISYDVVNMDDEGDGGDQDDDNDDHDIDGNPDRMDVNDDDDDDGGNPSHCRPPSALRASLNSSINRMKEYVLNQVLPLFLNKDDGCGVGDRQRRKKFDDVLRARPNLNPMGVM
jgi:hypothetical protein